MSEHFLFLQIKLETRDEMANCFAFMESSQSIVVPIKRPYIDLRVYRLFLNQYVEDKEIPFLNEKTKS